MSLTQNNLLRSSIRLEKSIKLVFITKIQSGKHTNHEIRFEHEIYYIENKKTQNAIKGIHFNEEDLKNERIKFCDLLKTEVING